jgi:hypothetical protein
VGTLAQYAAPLRLHRNAKSLVTNPSSSRIEPSLPVITGREQRATKTSRNETVPFGGDLGSYGDGAGVRPESDTHDLSCHPPLTQRHHAPEFDVACPTSKTDFVTTVGRQRHNSRQPHRCAAVRAKLCGVGGKYSGGIVAKVHGTRELLRTTGSERGDAGLVPLAYDNVHTINNSVRKARYVG